MSATPLNVPPRGPHFQSTTRVRGESYFREGRVQLDEMGEDTATFVVQGDEDYAVELKWGLEGWDGTCGCPAFARFGPCKHMLASALYLAEEGTASEIVAETRARWRHTLGLITEEVRHVVPDPSGPRDEVRLVVCLVRDFGNPDHLEIELRRQDRRKDGNLGIPKRIPSWSNGLVDKLGQEDAELLERLEGAREPYTLSLLEGGTARRVLSRALALEILPRAAGTGRLMRESIAGGSANPMEWDDGVPWQRVFAIREIGTGEAHLVPLLARGDQSREVREEDSFYEAQGLAIIAGVLGRYIVEPAAEKLGMAALGRELRADPEDAPEFVKSVAALVGDALREAPKLEWIEDVDPRPLLHVTGWAQSRGVQGEVGQRLPCEVACVYGEGEVSALQVPPLGVRFSETMFARRDIARERALQNEFIELGGEVDEHGACSARVGGFVALARRLMEAGWVIVADGAVVRSPTKWSVSVKSGQDWFDLEGGVTFHDEIVSIPELLEAARKRGGLVRLGNGKVGLLPERWLDQWGLLEIAQKRGEDAVRFQRSQGILLDAFLAERDLELVADAGFLALRQNIESFSAVQPIHESKSFHGELRPYQRVGLGWLNALRNLALGGCLADEMGLGKTVQILAHILRIREEGTARGPFLVVAPRSLAFQWMAEAERFAPMLSVLDHRGSDRKVCEENFGQYDIVITTYGTLRRDIEDLKDVAFDTVVLDEATAIKNARSQTAKAARLLRASNRVALTGTPVENHLGELWSLFEFLNPGMLGRATRFRELLKREAKGFADLAEGEIEEDQAPRFLEDVNRAIRPFLLRRLKQDVLADLPPRTVETLYVELGPRQRAEYDRIRAHFKAALLQRDDFRLDRMKVQVLEALLRLRQASCHVGLLDDARKKESSAKFDALFERIELLQEEESKALIFSQFTSLLDLVRTRLEDRKIDYELLTGRTRNRSKRIQRFQEDPDCRIFLISLKAGGHGLNLTAADTVYLLDPWWNPAVEDQAIDRVHRPGQTRPVFAYRLIARDTVEEKVLALQSKKEALTKAILGSADSLIGKLTRTELEHLLS